MRPEEILGLIDHSVLKPDATADDVIRACELGARYGVAAVCINSCWVELAAQHLHESGVPAGAAIGFPLGATTPRVKAGEAYNAVLDGARELDMVINIGALKSGDLELVRDDIQGVVDTSVEAAEVVGVECIVVKAILEMCYLTEAEKRTAVMTAVEAGVDFVKTSTGFGPGEATTEDVALMRELAPPEVGVKAAGGIRSLDDVVMMLEAGASRIGTSSTAAIAQGLQRGGR